MRIRSRKTLPAFVMAVIVLLCVVCGPMGNAAAGSGADGEDDISGIVTFYNEKTGEYLSCEGNRLILNKEPMEWHLKEADGRGYYVCSKNTPELMLDIDNAYVAEGTEVKLWKLTGYDVQIWKIIRNDNSSFSIAYSGDTQYCLGFSDGSARLELRAQNAPMQEWKMVRSQFQEEYLAIESEDGIIQLQLPADITDVVSEPRLFQWANDLETAYWSLYELTGFRPYHSIVVEAYRPLNDPGIIGWVMEGCNIIHIDSRFIYTDLQKMAARDCDWNFCVLHEMSHMFDFGMPWVFEAEVMADLKIAWVLEKNNAAAAPSEFGADRVFYGAGIADAYEILGPESMEEYDVFFCAKRFLEIGKDIGWEPFRQAFGYLRENRNAYEGCSNRERLEAFSDAVEMFGNKNVRDYFSDDEWNAILKYID